MISDHNPYNFTRRNGDPAKKLAWKGCLTLIKPCGSLSVKNGSIFSCVTGCLARRNVLGLPRLVISLKLLEEKIFANWCLIVKIAKVSALQKSSTMQYHMHCPIFMACTGAAVSSVTSYRYTVWTRVNYQAVSSTNGLDTRLQHYLVLVLYLPHLLWCFVVLCLGNKSGDGDFCAVVLMGLWLGRTLGQSALPLFPHTGGP